MAHLKLYDQELASRLAKLENVMDLHILKYRGRTNQDIIKYYKASSIGYRFIHSRQGSIHMALNLSGKFDRRGYLGQGKLVDQIVFQDHPTQVLELACGNGFNLDYLARRHPSISFVGIDLTPMHVAKAKKLLRQVSNVDIDRADFSDLPFDGQAFELVFAVESLCHAHDIVATFKGIRRVMTLGAKLVVIDGWRKLAVKCLSARELQALQVVEGSMAVGNSHTLEDWLVSASQCGFSVDNVLDLSDQIMPNLLRFERMAEYYLKWRVLHGALRAAFPVRLIENIAAAYLAPLTVRIGLHLYGCVTLKAI